MLNSKEEHDREYISDDELVTIYNDMNTNERTKEIVGKIIQARRDNKVILFTTRSRPMWDERHPWRNWEVTSQQSVYDIIRFGCFASNDWEYEIQLWERR